MPDLRSVPCPKCGKKGLHHPDHPHARGWKIYEKAVCRFCKAKFVIKEKTKLNIMTDKVYYHKQDCSILNSLKCDCGAYENKGVE